MALIPEQSQAKYLPMLRFGGAPVLGRPYAEAVDDIVIQIAHRKRCHRRPLCCQTLQ